MNVAQFQACGRSFVSSALVVTPLVAAFQAALPVLADAGHVFGEIECGSGAYSKEGFVQYQGVTVDDPAFGQFVLRLELELRREKANLWLAVYRPIPGTRKVSQLIESPLAYEELAETRSRLYGDDQQAIARMREFVLDTLDGQPQVLAAAFARVQAQLDSVAAP